MLTTVLCVSTHYKNLAICFSQLPGLSDVIFAEDVVAAELVIEEKQPEIVIADIELINQIHSESFLQKCQDRELIVISSNSKLAVNAFEIGATGFLLAPVNSDQLKNVIERAIKNSRQVRFQNFDIVERLFDRNSQDNYSFLDTKLILKQIGRVRFLDQKDITHVKGAGGNYVEIHFKDGGKILHRETLANIENSLNNRTFKRIHRSTIVNIDYVSEFVSLKTGGVNVKLKGGDEISLSKQKKTLVETVLGNY